MQNKGEKCSERVNAIYVEKSPEKRLKMLEEVIEECWEIKKLQEQILLSFYTFEEFVSEKWVRLILRISEKAFDNLFPHILDTLIKEIGKKKCREMLDILEKLIKEIPKNKIELKLYFFSEFIAYLSQGNLDEVIKRFRSWIADPIKKKIILESLKEILSIKRNMSDSELKQIYELLEEMAKLEGLDSTLIAKSEPNLRHKCGSLIESILNKPVRINIDLDLAKANFQKFRRIANFIGEDFFDKVDKIETYFQHPLLILLSDDLLEPEDYIRELKNLKSIKLTFDELITEELSLKRRLYHYSLLKHIDDGLRYINPIEKGTRDMRNKFIKQPERFQAILSEIEIIGRLRKKSYKVEMSPEIEIEENGTIVTKNLDLRVEIDGEDLLIEVISPEMMRELRYFGGAMIKKNRLKATILHEFFKKHKLDKMKLKKPVLFVVDISESEMDYETAKSCLEGSLGVQIRQYKNSQEVRLIRMNDSLHDLNQKTDTIIGLIVYRRILGSDGKIHLKGREFLNPHSNHPKKDVLMEKVKLAFLG